MFTYRAGFEKYNELKYCTACLFCTTHKHYWEEDEVEIHYFCIVAIKEHETDDRPEWCPLEEVIK